jgi:hypothetical protein
MVSCQEPSPLKESKHSQQFHPLDAVLVNALFFVSMGMEARCRPCHSAAHRQQMKRQPFLCNGCPRHGCCHCNRRRHLRRHCRLRCQLRRRCHHCCRCRRRRHHRCRHNCCRRRRCRRRCCCPSSSPLPSAIAVVVSVNHHCRHLCPVAFNHCCCRHPRHCPLPSPSPSAIAVAISVGHHRCHCRWPFPRVVALAQQELYSSILSKECLPYFILFGQWAAN